MIPFFAKKSFTNHISDVIDVGFHPYGPTLNLGGVLSTEKRVFLINHISTAVEIPSQTLRKEFDWFTLQPHSALTNQFEILKSPSKFVLSPGEPYKYYIMFVDNDRYAEMKTVLLNIISSWQGLRDHNENDKTADELFDEFCQLPMTRELNGMLRSLCYWESGTYNIDLCVNTKDDTSITKKSFQLNDDDIEQLKDNSSNIIASACGRASSNYNIVKVDLSNVK